MTNTASTPESNGSCVQPKARKKSPAVAFFLSLLVPGMGYFYCGRNWWGIGILIVFVLSTLSALILGSYAELFTDSQLVLISVLPLFLYAFAALDAYFTAREISSGRPATVKNKRLAAALNLVVSGSGYWYVGEVSKGVLVFLLVSLISIGGMAKRLEDGVGAIMLLGGLLTLLVASASDAYRIAARRNQEDILIEDVSYGPVQTRFAFSALFPLGFAFVVAYFYLMIVTVTFAPRMSPLIVSAARFSMAMTLFSVDRMGSVVVGSADLSDAIDEVESTLDTFSDVLMRRLDEKKKGTLESIRKMSPDEVNSVMEGMKPMDPRDVITAGKSEEAQPVESK